MNALSLVEKIACLPSQEKAQIEWLADRFLASPTRKGCDCHVVDPRKQSMIIWPSRNPKHADDLIVKFIDQRLVALPRVDKRGEKYWKVRDFYENEEKDPEISQTFFQVSAEPKPEINQPLSDSSVQNDRITKFRERQAKAQQIQAKKQETKWLTAEEHEARLSQEKAARESQQEEITKNANNSITANN